MKKKDEEMSPEAKRLDEIRHQIVDMSFDECKADVGQLLDELNDLYFDWFERVVEEAQKEQNSDYEVVASENPGDNVVHLDFRKKEKE